MHDLIQQVLELQLLLVNVLLGLEATAEIKLNIV